MISAASQCPRSWSRDRKNPAVGTASGQSGIKLINSQPCVVRLADRWLVARPQYLAEKTVKNYVSALFAKLGMERRTQAAAYAARVFEEQDGGKQQDSVGG